MSDPLSAQAALKGIQLSVGGKEAEAKRLEEEERKKASGLGPLPR